MNIFNYLAPDDTQRQTVKRVQIPAARPNTSTSYGLSTESYVPKPCPFTLLIPSLQDARHARKRTSPGLTRQRYHQEDSELMVLRFEECWCGGLTLDPKK